MSNTNTMTVQQAAGQYGIHAGVLLAAIKAGLIEATRTGRTWAIDRSSLQQFVSQRNSRTSTLSLASNNVEEGSESTEGFVAVATDRSKLDYLRLYFYLNSDAEEGTSLEEAVSSYIDELYEQITSMVVMGINPRQSQLRRTGTTGR